jgi:hypothetical protein
MAEKGVGAFSDAGAAKENPLDRVVVMAERGVGAFSDARAAKENPLNRVVVMAEREGLLVKDK